MDKINKISEKLASMTDEELLDYHVKLQDHHLAELSMDGSGELGHVIDADFQVYYDAIYAEYNKRPHMAHMIEGLEPDLPY